MIPFNDIMPRTIQWPTGNKIRKTSDVFSDISGLLNVLGAVDESHIPIKAPAKNRNAYYIRKKYHSVVLLASSDVSLRFTYAWTGNSGVPMHDATVVRASELFQQSHNLIPAGYYILRDSAGWLHLFEIMEIWVEINVFSILPTVNQTCNWKTFWAT